MGHQWCVVPCTKLLQVGKCQCFLGEWETSVQLVLHGMPRFRRFVWEVWTEIYYISPIVSDNPSREFRIGQPIWAFTTCFIHRHCVTQSMTGRAVGVMDCPQVVLENRW